MYIYIVYMSFRCSSFLPLAKEQGVSVRTTSRRFRGFSRCVSCLIYLSIWKILYRQLGSSPKWIEHWTHLKLPASFSGAPVFGGKKQHAMKDWRTQFSFLKRPFFLLQRFFLKNPRRCVLPLACIHAAPSNCSLWATSMQNLEISLFPAGRTRSGPPAVADFGDPNGMTFLGDNFLFTDDFRRFGSWQLPVPFCLEFIGQSFSNCGHFIDFGFPGKFFHFIVFQIFHFIDFRFFTKNKCQKTPKTNETINSDPTHRCLAFPGFIASPEVNHHIFTSELGRFHQISGKNTLWLCPNSYWKWPFIVSFPIKNGDFP